MRLAGYQEASVVDGPGLNFVLYAQGCKLRCPGCHNPGTHALDGGFEMEEEAILALIANSPLATGVTFSGGEATLQLDAVLRLARRVRERRMRTLLYTGYTLVPHGDDYALTVEGSPKNVARIVRREDLGCFDHVVDGMFRVALKSLEHPFRGSSNQRLLTRGIDYCQAADADPIAA